MFIEKNVVNIRQIGLCLFGSHQQGFEFILLSQISHWENAKKEIRIQKNKCETNAARDDCSPIISTRANTISEMVKAMCIPNKNFTLTYF